MPPMADYGRLVDIGGGRRVYLECTGEGSPTVLLVPGQRASAQEWHTSQSEATPPAPPVFETVAETNRVCTYDRGGVTTLTGEVSRSDPAPQPVTAGAAAEDLWATLQAAGEEGPFVVVGHSAGGMVSRIFTTSHADQVQGLVLVDPPTEFLQDELTAEERVWQEKMFKGDMAESIAEYPALERFDPSASFAELRSSPALPLVPFVLLSADEKLGPTFTAMKASSGAWLADVPDTFGYRFDDLAARAHEKLAALIPGSVHITETHSGHNIHMIQPQLVTDAIRFVLAAIALEG